MSWFLNATYVCFLVLASPWLLWRSCAQGKNRRGWMQKLFGLVGIRKSKKRCVWLHAVSVGEVNLLAPILEHWQKAQPELEFVISTTTETGFDLARNKYAGHYVFFCPMDFTWAIKRVLKRLRPDMLVLAELELWPNLIQTTRRAGIPVAVVNGRLSANSFQGYRRIGWIVRRSFENLTVVAAQNETYADRFRQLGCDPECVHVTGSVKFDGVEADPNNPLTLQLARLAEIVDDEQVFVAGSTQEEEDLLTAKIYQQMSQSNPNLRLILVPRHPDRCRALVEKLNHSGMPTVLRSTLNSDQASADPVFAFRDTLRPVLIVDVIGELGGWWGCADAAYVGGSMGKRGGQNMIEPAAYGVPVAFGPNTENFRDIVEELLVNDAATVVRDAEEVRVFLNQALTQTKWAKDMGQRSRSVIQSHAGASQRTIDHLCNLLPSSADQNSTENSRRQAA